MGSASSFLFRSNNNRTNNSNENNAPPSGSETRPSGLPNVSTPQQQRNNPQVYNHVVSTDDGRISSQRLRIETPRETTEFHQSQLGGVIMSSEKFTPRPDILSEADQDHKCSVPYTPNGDEANIYKYYCPLCMQYYKFMWKSQCCANYICLPCTQDYLKAKGVVNMRLESHKMEHIFCPHCQTNGFSPIMVDGQESIRDYHYSCEPVSSHIMPSPLRIGESFEDLKRKMIPFKALAPISSSSNSVHASPVLQVVGSEKEGQFDPTESQASMRGIAIPNDEETLSSPAMDRYIVALFEATPRDPTSSRVNVDDVNSPLSPILDNRAMDHHDDGIDRLASSIPIQATPVVKGHRPDMIDSDVLDESVESLVFPRLQENMILSPVSISETSPNCARKLPRTMAVNFVHEAIDAAFHHMQTSQ